MNRALVASLLALGLAACAAPTVPADDAGEAIDAGPRDDARPPGDASVLRDASDASRDDARVEADASAPDDAAIAVDACAIDVDGDGDRSPACGGGDCDDTDPTRSSLLPEACGAPDVDEDCDGDVDEDVIVPLHADLDHDGYGEAGWMVMGCPSADLIADGTDCDDARADVSPGASELCENVRDDDCDTIVDESGPQTFYLDADGDGFGVPGTTLMGTSCTPPAGYAANAVDCDDARAATFPGNPVDPCNALDDQCENGVAGGGVDVEDADGDLHGRIGACGGPGGFPGDDCDDTRTTVHPGATEICDRLDDDCSTGGGALPAEDVDDDGYAPYSTTCRGGFPQTDCNDTVATIHPGAPELCNRVDEDCSLRFGGSELGEDGDGDMHASPTAMCSGGFPKDDCNDAQATIYPGAPERCDTIDQNCSNAVTPGGTDPTEDVDADRHSAPDAACSGGYARDDCDDTNPAFHPGAPTLGPRIITPVNGAHTSRGMTRPTFRWERTGDACLAAPYYEIVADDSCGNAFSCDFYMMTPELRDTSVTTTTYTPATGLTAGRRSFYHVRECTGPGTGCGAWSVIRYIDVGLPAHDLNGDGYSDVVIGAPDYHAGFGRPGRAYVYYGSASGTPSVPSQILEAPPDTIADTHFGRSVAIGDLTGDGYADVVIASADEAYLYTGSATGVPATPGTSSSSFGTDFGRVMAFVGDVNADGYEDLAVGAPATTGGEVLVYYGGSSGISPAYDVSLENPERTSEPDSGFGMSVAGAGDVNGDGYDDVVVGAPQRDAPEVDEGNVYVYLGNRFDLGSYPALTIDSPSDQAGASFGASLGGGDVNRDGWSDVMAGAPLFDGSSTDEGRVVVFSGAASGLAPIPSLTIEDLAHEASAHFGATIAVSDLTGDGYLDAIVGEPERDGAAIDAGNVIVYAGGASGLGALPTATLSDATGTAMGLGASISSVGDLNADGVDDLRVGAPRTSGPELGEGAALLWLGGASISSAPALVLDDPTDQAGAHFGSAVASAERRGRRTRQLVRERSVGIVPSRREDAAG